MTNNPTHGLETMNTQTQAQTSLQAQLSDQQLERLETLLADPALPAAMRLDEIQGYLCAALSGPQPLPAERWLIDALGNEEAQDSAVGREAAELLRRFANALEAELARGEAPVLLLYAKEGDSEGEGPSDYSPWCQAYLHGVDAAQEDWFESLGYDENSAADEETDEEMSFLDERLFPLMLLTGEAEAAAREHGEAWPQDEELMQMENDCEEDLPQAVADIYRFWLAKRGVKTIRRETAKIGRNDPCPCASGKKFKLCCGIEG